MAPTRTKGIAFTVLISDKMRNLFKKWGPVDYINAAITFIVFVFYLFSVSKSPYKWEPLLVFGGAVLYIRFNIYLRNKKNRKGWEDMLLLFYPVLFLFLIFESFFMILPWFNTNVYDAQLARLDFRLLGVHPTVWIERFISPWFTDLLYVCYFLYFPMPWFLLVWLARKGKYNQLDKMAFILLMTYYLGYIGYFSFPAMGPRYFEPLMQLQTKDLNGVFLAVPIRNLILYFEPNKFDAFPSLHAAASLTVIIMMYRYNKVLFYIFLPVVIGIFISVIYCRYHYFVDVIAGVVISLLSVFLGGKLYNFAFKGTTNTYYQ